MASEYTPSGVRRAGDDYQDIIALDLLVEWLEHPERYEWVRVESDEAGFLDDVVALQAGKVLVAKQVKFSAHPNDDADPYSWDDLLKQRTSKKGMPLPSLLSKWGKSLQDLKVIHAGVAASLVSNRKPGDDIRSSFAEPGVVNLDRIADPTVRELVITQLGDEQTAREFLSAFKFELDQPGLDTLQEAVSHRFLRLHGDIHGWTSLKDEVRRWVRERKSPPPDGKITLAAIKTAAGWQRLEVLPEEFAVPTDFVIPDTLFHEGLMRSLRTIDGKCVVLTGPPGIGKSTYISNLFQELRTVGIQVIRHHFFLSRDDTTPFRYDHTKVAESLMSGLQAVYSSLGLASPTGNPRPRDLSVWIADCGRRLSERGEKLVVILDGLDHVWSETCSVEELNRLFQLITPIPPGVVLLIGTQPVDSSQLPRRLSEVAPRDTWMELPALVYSAVRQWAQFHASDLKAIRNGDVEPHVLDDLSEALWRKSEGYPLHLRYILRSLEEVKGFIIAREIEHLPGIPHRDILRYYASFWRDLPDESKQVLSLLATCDFAWSRAAIAECLDPACRNLAIDGAIRRVAHLTSEGPLGLQFAHSSLEFFVRQHADYQNYAARVRSLALDWLRSRAPDVLRWSYEWLLAAEAGDEEPLLGGPSREWLIEGMARRYPVHIADRILTRCAWVALKRGTFNRFVEVGLLSDYLAEATDSRENVFEALLGPQLAIQEDPTVLDRSLGDLKSLGNLEVRCLAEACERAGMGDSVGECFDRLNARIRTEQGGRNDVYPQMDSGRCLARIAAFDSEVESPRVLHWLRDKKGTKFGTALWRDYTDSLRTHGQAERLRAVILGTDDLPGVRTRALADLVLLLCENGVDALAGGLSDNNSSDPFVILASTVRGQAHSLNVPVEAPEPWVLRLKEYEFYQHYDEMSDYLWRMFFVFAANCVLGKNDENTRLTEPFEGRGWIGGFLRCAVSAASEFAQQLSLRESVSYSWIFDRFREIRPPDFIQDRTGHGFATAARKAIFRLAMDLQALQAGVHSPSIYPNDIDAVRRTPLFVLPIWLEITADYRRAWFTVDGLANTLSMIDSHLASTIDDFGSRAELCELAADIAALHGDRAATAKWVRECWSNLIAYGYHKDMLLDQCLDAVEHLRRANCSTDALKLLARLTPAVIAVGDYTDGDETRHLPAELGRILFRTDFPQFVRYHEWLSVTEEYWDAHSIFETFVAKADLHNHVFRAVAETAVERENLLALAKRSGQGDTDAAECLGTMPFFGVPSGNSRAERAAPDERTRAGEGGTMPAPGDFPPENFRAYLEATQAANSYREDDDVDRWARLWADRGRERDVLDVLDAHDSGRFFLSGDSKLRFDLTLKVKGRQAAYEALVAAQHRQYGWNRYYSRSEDVRYIWAKLKEIYPQNWLPFLQSTLMLDPQHVNRSGVTARLYISRLVEFLLFMEQMETAKGVVVAASETTIQLVPLKFPPPTWIQGERP